jgi:DNA-binding transcriptional LysR family regulator
MVHFLAQPHVLVTRTSGHGIAEDVLQKLDDKRRIKLRLPHFSVLPKVIPGAELLVILRSQIAESFCEMPLTKPLITLELPLNVPAFEGTLHWHSRSIQSTGLSWFFEQIQATPGETGVA